MEDRIVELTAEEWEQLRRAAEVVDGKRAGFLVTDRPPGDLVFRLWDRCGGSRSRVDRRR